MYNSHHNLDKQENDVRLLELSKNTSPLRTSYTDISTGNDFRSSWIQCLVATSYKPLGSQSFVVPVSSQVASTYRWKDQLEQDFSHKLLFWTNEWFCVIHVHSMWPNPNHLIKMLELLNSSVRLNYERQSKFPNKKATLLALQCNFG